MELNNLKPGAGSKHARRRVGRGIGSGLGKTSGRGHKGQKSRAGGFHKVGFEGGQMPLQRRLPKRGFNNIFKIQPVLITLAMLDRFEAGTTVDQQALVNAGLIKDVNVPVKVLANGELHKALTVKLAKLSQGAREQIVAAGGTAEEV